MLLDQFSEPESLVEFAHQDQAAVGSDARALETDLEGGVKGELKGLVWGFTTGVRAVPLTGISAVGKLWTPLLLTRLALISALPNPTTRQPLHTKRHALSAPPA